MESSSMRRRQGRAATACVSCHRRKQKCDGQWPCNRCQTRNAAHLCQFSHVPQSASSNGATKNDGSTSIQATARPELADSSSHVPVDNMPGRIESGIYNSLGYYEDGLFKEITSQGTSTTTAQANSIRVPDHVREAARTVPPRPYTDLFIQNFFENVNHHYCLLHQPSFMTTYVSWWSRRRDSNASWTSSDNSFTCLVLRVCANSSQFLPSTLRGRIESELGDSAKELGVRYQAAANTLSNAIRPGAGGLVQVQQHFLDAIWLKNEAEVIDAWHALATAVRVAQEIGMQTENQPPSMAELERELRRRVWCVLFTWDRFMCAIFKRPALIHGPYSVPLPNPKVDEISVNPEVPSPIIGKVLENSLATCLSELATGDGNNGITGHIAHVENWMASLPPVFRLELPDTRFDSVYPHVPFQRRQLHCVGYSTLLQLLRPYLTGQHLAAQPTPQAVEASEPAKYISWGVNASLKLMDVCKSFFDLCYPDNARYFIVLFCPFDTAALLCSAIWHSQRSGTTLPRRHEVIKAIGKALHMCYLLVDFTAAGAMGWHILGKLVSILSLSDAERRAINEQGKEESPTAAPLNAYQNAGSVQANSILSESHIDSGITLGSTNIGIFTGDNTMMASGAVAGAEFLAGVDMEFLDGAWDWGALNFRPT